MESLLTIGELAARCGLSRSALRFYDHAGLLRPQVVDEDTGYRRYGLAQIAQARLIRHLRAAELPVDVVREFLDATPARRSSILAAHAVAFRERAATVQSAIDELQDTLSTGGWFQVAPEVLAAALEQLRFAIADPASRPELGGLWIETREESLRLVATDSYRMAVRDLVPDVLGPVPVRGMLDGKRLPAFARALPGASSLTIRQDEAGVIKAALDGRGLPVGGPGDGFPDYERVLDGVPVGGEIVVARDALVRAIATLAPSSVPVSLRFRSGGIVVAADDGDRAAVPGAWSGADLDVRLDRAFLSQALQATVGPDVAIEAVDPRAPLTLRSADTGSFCVLTMPLAPEG